MAKISAVINTYNEEKKLSRTLASLKGFASEIVVVDMMSTDSTREIAKMGHARVFKHKKIGFVEPARNFAISKARNDWILIIDADEELPEELKLYLKKEVKNYEPKKSPNFYRIPRRNVIFGKWIKHTGWWPDYNIRFFRKDTVNWENAIHSIPLTKGKGIDLPAKEEYAIKHKAYSSLEEYVTRMNRYTTIQAKELNKKGVEFVWTDILLRPTAEFLRRYFAEAGYKDGLHGLSLSLLQAFSELVLYMKLWQKQKFIKRKVSLDESNALFKKVLKDIGWWFYMVRINDENNLVQKIWLKLLKKLKYQ